MGPQNLTSVAKPGTYQLAQNALLQALGEAGEIAHIDDHHRDLAPREQRHGSGVELARGAAHAAVVGASPRIAASVADRDDVAVAASARNAHAGLVHERAITASHVDQIVRGFLRPLDHGVAAGDDLAPQHDLVILTASDAPGTSPQQREGSLAGGSGQTRKARCPFGRLPDHHCVSSGSSTKKVLQSKLDQPGSHRRLSDHAESSGIQRSAGIRELRMIERIIKLHAKRQNRVLPKAADAGLLAQGEVRIELPRAIHDALAGRAITGGAIGPDRSGSADRRGVDPIIQPRRRKSSGCRKSRRGTE